MSKSLKDKYTVENVPILLKPIFWLYGYGLGAIVYLLIYTLSKSLKIEKIKAEGVNDHENYIYCFWHQDLIGFYTTFNTLNGFDMINHPAWYMKPIHVFSKLCGLENIFYGSTGNSGKSAAQQLAKSIAKGKNTFITPDGPIGPNYKLNKGVLHLSKDSGRPIVVLKFDYSSYTRLSGWDRKYMPIPFSKIKVQYLQPIQVTPNNFEECIAALENYLSL